MDHKKYLENFLTTKKLMLEELNIEERIALAEYNIKRNLLRDDINSIESQLSCSKK